PSWPGVHMATQEQVFSSSTCFRGELACLGLRQVVWKSGRLLTLLSGLPAVTRLLTSMLEGLSNPVAISTYTGFKKAAMDTTVSNGSRSKLGAIRGSPWLGTTQWFIAA
ncbi:hypothetical protein IL306_012491, partial [Fusarium sp. DS 682]